jgi:hypothetical protein
MIKVVVEQCITCTGVAKVTALLLPQGHSQGAAVRYCTNKNKNP